MTKQVTNRMTTDSPCVSVVMPVYNGEPYLREAIESILNQTFTDFEFIIVNDGSTDRTAEILTTYAAQDHRIRLVRNERNLGLIKTLNKGGALAQGKYIARHDADDISLPERLARQVDYLEQHPEVGILGTAYYRMFTDGQHSLRQPPLTDTEIRWRLLFGNIWCHPSMMFRRHLLTKGEPIYNNFFHAEDYELWLRLLKRTRAATLPVPLVEYRVHERSICVIHSEPQEQMVTTISTRQIQSLLPHHSLSQAEINTLRQCHLPKQLMAQEMALCPVMFQLFNAFAQQPGIDPIAVRRLRRQWIKWVLAAVRIRQWPLLLTSGLLGVILRHDPIAVLIAGLIHFPKRIIRQVSRAKAAEVADVPSGKSSAVWQKETKSKMTGINFSGVVVCYNEAHLLRRCLASLDFCRELIVVDLGSTDDSVRVAKEMGATVLFHQRLPNPNVPRQYGISHAKNEWVFTIDADEVFPKDEVHKLEAVILEQPDLAAIRVPIQYYFKGKKLNCTVWGRPDITRWTVIHRDCVMGTPYAHQEFKLDQNIYYFSWSDIEPIEHYWRNSYLELYQKMWPYIKIEGEGKYAAGERFSWRTMFRQTLITLKANLINFRGLYGGFTGIALSLSHTWYVLMSWLSLRQYEQRQVIAGKG
jgi:glycosyltransferase involved in cell wall biosynthesis